jgi:hypothetical protein
LCFRGFFIGGAAITQKTELETINESILAITALQLREAMEMRSPFVKMDWSRGNSSAEDVNMQILSLAAFERHLDFPNAFVVVHGAGFMSVCFLLFLSDFFSFPSFLTTETQIFLLSCVTHHWIQVWAVKKKELPGRILT